MWNVNSKEDLVRLLHIAPFEVDNILRNVGRFYRVKRIPKGGGKFRILRIPMGRLRILQDKIQDHILALVDMPPYLHGGVRSRSNRTNASEHRRKACVVKIDIKDYYPHIRPERVRKVFERLGFSGEAAGILTAVTTHDFQLPQGPPTSPVLANLAIPRIDARLRGIAKQQHLSQGRFVDDIAISGGRRTAKFATLLARILAEDGFEPKTGTPQTMFRNDPQVITGCSVNWKINVERQKRHKALKHAVDTLKSGQAESPSDLARLSHVAYMNRNVGKAPLKELKRRNRTGKQQG